MDFFDSLTLDLKMLVVALAGFALLALFSGNQKAEKRYLVVFALLAAVGVYRFNSVGGDEHQQSSAATRSKPIAPAAPPKHTPLISTSAR